MNRQNFSNLPNFPQHSQHPMMSQNPNLPNFPQHPLMTQNPFLNTQTPQMSPDNGLTEVEKQYLDALRRGRDEVSRSVDSVDKEKFLKDAKDAMQNLSKEEKLVIDEVLNHKTPTPITMISATLFKDKSFSYAKLINSLKPEECRDLFKELNDMFNE